MSAIKGYCPMGCGETLFVGAGGYITCSYIPCPKPGAVATLLDDRETEHVVEFGGKTFVIWHPLREHIEHDALFLCSLHAHITGLSGPPVKPGRYHAIRSDNAIGGERWSWWPIQTEATP